MTIKLKNNWHYQNDDRWEWELFLDSDNPKELDNVEKVKYILHPTFPDPIRMVKNPSEGFRLKTNGWGTFKTQAFVYFKDGKKKKLVHNLDLQYDPPIGESEV